MENYHLALLRLIAACAQTAAAARPKPDASPAEINYLTGCRKTAEHLLYVAQLYQANIELLEYQGPLH